MKELLRRGLRAAVTSALRLRSRPCLLEVGSRCLIIAPHQDDEALGCAGLILARRAAGLPVSIVYITDGAGSHPNHPHVNPTDLARLRRAEATQAMLLLKVEAASLQFLNAPDGTLAHLSPAAFEAIAQRLAALIAPLAPTELFLPCRADGSSEHTAAFHLTQRALQIARLKPRLFEYPVWARWSPQRLIRPALTGRVWRHAFPGNIAVKRAALACYVSQVAPTPPWPQPVLPAGFAESFDSDEEFFFEPCP